MHRALKYRPLSSGLLLWLLISWVPSYAQNHELDSLKSLLDNSKVDTVQVKILNEISYSILNQDPNEAIEYGIQARDMSQLLGYNTGKAYALKNIGLGYYYLGDYLKVLDYWSESLESFETEQDTLGIANMLNNLGAIYYTQGSNSKAIEYYLQSLRIAEKLGDTIRIASALVNVGGLYSDNEKDYDKALDYFWQVGNISKVYQLDDQSHGGYLTGIGELHKNMGQYDSAIYYLAKALPLYQNTVLIPEALIRLGMVHEARGDFDEAVKYQEQAY